MNGGLHMVTATCKRLFLLIVGLSLFFSPVLTHAAAPVDSQAEAKSLLQQMTTGEKIGQLFLINFSGTNVAEKSQIRDLIINYHIGGVILAQEYNNFTDTDILANIQSLTSSLQTLAMEPDPTVPVTVGNPQNASSTSIPLFISISQDGNGFPSDQILSGLTSLPNAMAIGATWDPDMATQAGEVLGSELAALGINMLFGPSLDVVDSSNPESPALVGTNSFGGDPYWVGRMSQAFVSGLHQGSSGQLAVIAKHFPGLGGVDRDPQEEISTVMKSLEQLKQLELAPFFVVTNPGATTSSVIDGLLVSHIRYQGFQGNIRATTRPVSLDATALSQLLSQDELSTWHNAGGLIVSDSLGSEAIRRFYTSAEVSYEPWQVARTAFLAGNDLLVLSNVRANNDLDEYTTLVKTLEFFVQKYQEDAIFAQRVDSTVERILACKIRQYPSMALTDVLPDSAALASVGLSDYLSASIAQHAATLISPSSAELVTLLPTAPSLYEYITVFTDVRAAQQCSTCAEQRILSITSFRNSLLRLYGPQSGNEILENRISSYSFNQLTEILDNISEPSEPFLVDNLKRSDWVIFNVLEDEKGFPASDALKRILAERPDLLQDKNIIVFGYDTPYYLDATELSKVTAYYALYSQVPAFVDVAVRILMQEVKPAGDLPVSVSSVSYDLIQVTSPDPTQVIPLTLLEPNEQPDETLKVEATQIASLSNLEIGETIVVQAGLIKDHNQHPVPDGTIVRFTFRVPGENIILQQKEVATVNGMAVTSYKIDRLDNLAVTAQSEPALTSNLLLLNIESGVAEVFAPTSTPAPQPTPTLMLTQESTQQVTPEAEVTNKNVGYPKPYDWLVIILVVAAGFGLAYLIGFLWWGTVRWGLRSGLCAAIGGLVSFVYLNLGLPGTLSWVERSGTWFVIEMALVGLLLGWIFALVWWMRKTGGNF